MAKLNDEEMTGRVIAELGASPRVRATALRVHTRQSWVRLDGTVDTLAQKTAAEEVTKHVKGVAGVQNDLVVSSDRALSDADIACHAAERLTDEGFPAVGVRVQAGTAFLMGTVASLAVKKRAIEIASSVKGVRDVISELEIAAGEPVDDTTLANDVAEALSDSPDVDIMNLDVRAIQGSVLLAGELTHPRQLDLATTIAEAVPGVQYVENRMTIRKLPT